MDAWTGTCVAKVPLQAPSSPATKQSRPVALPVAFLLGRALVVLLLALGEADLQLGAAVLPVQLQRHDGVSAPLGGADQAVELAPVQQQFARAHRIGHLVRGGGSEWGDVCADEECFAIADVDVGLGELRASGAHRLDFPSLERKPGFESILDE